MDQLKVEANVAVGSRGNPTVTNSVLNIAEVTLQLLPMSVLTQCSYACTLSSQEASVKYPMQGAALQTVSDSKCGCLGLSTHRSSGSLLFIHQLCACQPSPLTAMPVLVPSGRQIISHYPSGLVNGSSHVTGIIT